MSMKVYKFIFIVGFLNLIIPFLSVPFVYKNYISIVLAIITLGYALIVRAVAKEKENYIAAKQTTSAVYESPIAPIQNKTIEDVVEMVEQKERLIISDVTPKRRGRKPKVAVREEVYE